MYMRQILRFDELDSTNAYAKRNCSLLSDQTVLVARTQTAGRGRMKRVWLSQAGGLYFSVLLKPSQTQFLPNLTQWMALAVCESAREAGAEAFLKWPNDVLAGGKKLCGILSEAVTGKNGFEALVLGVGVNVAQADLSRAGQPAVSLKMLGIALTPEEMLQRILDRFFEGYEQVVNRGFESIREAYLARFPYIGQPVTIRYGAQEAAGTVQTLSPRGTLLLQTPQGVTEISIGDMMV